MNITELELNKYLESVSNNLIFIFKEKVIYDTSEANTVKFEIKHTEKVYIIKVPLEEILEDVEDIYYKEKNDTALNEKLTSLAHQLTVKIAMMAVKHIILNIEDAKGTH